MKKRVQLSGGRGQVKNGRKKEFNRLRLDKDGNSGIDCWVCFKDAKWIKQGGGFYCDGCKKKNKKQRKTCSECGAAL